MAIKFPSLSLGLALAGLLGAGAASAQSPAANAGQMQNPHSPDNAKRTGDDAPAAGAAAPAQDANPHSTDNKDRAAGEGKGPSATGAAEAGNPHSVKNKDHHGKRHHKGGDARPTAAPATPEAK